MSATLFDLAELSPPAMTIRPRPYQAEALAAVAANARRGVRRQLIVMPTGAGKTVVFSALIASRLPGRALVLAHRDELIEQAAKKLRDAMPGQRVGIVKAETDQHYYPVVVASIQTLARSARRARLRGRFDTVIVDEAHHAQPDNSYGAVLEHVGVGRSEGPLLVGVTATPDRGDGRGLDGVFDEIVYQALLLDLIAQGYLCDVRALRIELEVELDRVGTRRGDFDQAAMTRTLEATETAYWTARAIAEHAPERRTVVFAQSVALAHDTAGELNLLGIAAEALDDETPLDRRRSILARFAAGRLQAVCNFGILTEGFDCPEISCVAIARPTKSRLLYTQMAGRGFRVHPAKADCLLLDIVGMTTRHQLQTAATLTGIETFGAKRAIADRAGMDQAPGLVETMRQLGGLLRDPVSGRLVAMPVELFANHRIAWISRGDGAWLLPAGAASIQLVPNNGQWTVVARDADGARELAAGLDLGYAQGVAEDEARRLGAANLINRAAPWRREPATPKQIAMTRALGIDVRRLPLSDGVLTKGVVSDAISAARARRGVA